MNQNPIAYLNSNDGSGLLAFGEGERFIMDQHTPMSELQEFIDAHKDKYLFGYLGYDLKNQLHGLTSNNEDKLKFPEAFLWVPKYVVNLLKENFDFFQGEKNAESLEYLNQFMEEETDQNHHHYNFEYTPSISKEKYIETVQKLKEEIKQGNIYEVTFCHEYHTAKADMNYRMDSYFKLNEITLAPFSSYLQFDEFSVFCGSPERFLKKTGNKLISQPIKGTAPRGTNEIEDERLKAELQKDPKERAENIMIVDLVRNDLSRIAVKNSVQVEELCEIYTFETVHQMISTIACELKPDVKFIDIIKATFPMGSMTGAPKLKSMELIEKYESFKRGLFSGSILYMSPNGDFDLNVVIRTLLYNQKEQYLSCAVGSAITIQSDPEKEYEECRVKVQRILDGMND